MPPTFYSAEEHQVVKISGYPSERLEHNLLMVQEWQAKGN